MILVDYREGSAALEPKLEALGLEAAVTTLDFGDIAFEGRGDKGVPVDIGIEFKQLRECVGSMRSGRLARQCRGMRKMYEVRFLLVEGELLYDRRGTLLRRVGRRDFAPMDGGMGIGEFLKRIFVQHACNGVTPLFARDERHTLKILEILYRTWTDQNLDEHQSHLALYQPPTFIEISDKRATFKTFPDIGDKLSLAVERTFGGSITRAVNSSVSEWASIETVDKKGHPRKLGHVAAQRIKEYLK